MHSTVYCYIYEHISFADFIMQTYFEVHIVQIACDGHLATVLVGLRADGANNSHTSWGVFITNLHQIEDRQHYGIACQDSKEHSAKL